MRRILWIVMAGALVVLIDPRITEADGATIVGRWCGDKGYGLTVEGDGIRFHPRPRAYAAPADNIDIGRDRATYSQHYAEEDITVNCTLLLTDSETATETCNSPTDAFYPHPGESAVLRRCTPMPEPLPQPGV